jgi:hypothetical protein
MHLELAPIEFPSAKVGTIDSQPLGIGENPGAKIPGLFEVLVGAGEAQPGRPVTGETELQTSIPGDADILEVVPRGPSRLIGGILVTIGS